MKSLFAFILLGLLGAQSAIIDNNEIDGPNNVVYFGQGNKLSGRDNKVAGFDNNVNGVANGAIGKQNTLNGVNNLVAGIGNQVTGQDNFVIGQGNLIIGSDSSQQDIQKVNQRLAEMFAARGLGNVMGMNTVNNVQSQPISQNQNQVRTQNQVQTQTVSPVINQVQTQQQSQVQFQPQQSVQIQPLPQPPVNTEVKVQPLIRQTDVESQKVIKTSQDQVQKQQKQKINSESPSDKNKIDYKTLQVYEQNQIPAPKLQVVQALDVKQIMKTEQPKAQQTVVKLDTQEQNENPTGDNILFNDTNLHHQTVQPEDDKIQHNSILQIKHQRQVPIQTVSQVETKPAAQLNKLINLKQDKSFLFVIHDDTTDQALLKSQKSQDKFQNEQSQQQQSGQKQSQRYRRVSNHISPQLRPSYPKINQNSNRLLTVVQMPSMLSSMINVSNDQNERKRSNLRRNDDQIIEQLDQKIDNGNFNSANEIASAAIASGSQNVILVSSVDNNNSQVPLIQYFNTNY